MTVLIFDDDEDFLGRLNSRFKAQPLRGLRVNSVWCNNAAKAQKAVEKYNPDILFADHMLGLRENAFEVAKKAAENGIHVFTTSGASPKVLEMYANLGIPHVPKSQVADKILELFEK
ncbi:MAG TPA: hypothetical protein VHF05_02320 [Candidatus Paceibacterota bacterium]|nr:hypothetical protein [Candidatus Paceibacterota bacterium]